MRIRSITAPNPGPLTLDGTRTYLIGETTVIDPGPLIGSHLDAITAAQPGLAAILVTHRHADHAPAALPLRERTGAKIFAPRGVLEDADQQLRGGEHLAFDDAHLEVIATPGHTREHVCFLSAEGDLFTGDTILGSGTTTIFPPDGDMGQYLSSLRLLRSRNPRRIHPGHGPTRNDAVGLIDEYLAHRLERERQVIEAVAQGAGSIAAMRKMIYPELDSRLWQAAETQLGAHLIKLIGERRVAQSGESYRLV